MEREVILRHKNFCQMKSGKKIRAHEEQERERIILRPDNKGFPDIVLENVREGEFHVVAEFVKVVG